MAAGEAVGKFLYDIVAERLKAQAADQSALTGRAKDLVGLAAVTTTVTGVLANDKLFDVTKGSQPIVFAVLLSFGLLLTIGAGLYGLKPRVWYLSPDPTEVFSTVSGNLAWPLDSYYASVATGLTQPGVVVTGKSALAHNDEQLVKLRRAIVIQVVGVAILASSGLVVAWQATR